METKEILTHSPEETIEIAAGFAKKLPPGSILALEGDLGSGKTTFIKGVAQAYGLANADDVTSPTFTLMNIYSAEIPVYHFDLYRLDKIEDVSSIGFEEFIYDQSAIKCVEWAEKAHDLMPANAYKISFETVSETSRKITLPDLD